MNTSSYEQHIIKILRASNVRFVREKTYEDLKGGRYRFDFYLPAYNCLIEADGIQHFKQVTKFQKTRADFLRQQEHDRQKNSYCLAHGIKLYRIPYWEFPNIATLQDIFQSQFLVKSKWHNDYLTPK